MSWGDVVPRQTGTVAALLVVEGRKGAFSTTDWQFPATLVSDRTAGDDARRYVPEQYKGFLLPESVQWATSINYRTGELNVPEVTFSLKDLPIMLPTWTYTPPEPEEPIGTPHWAAVYNRFIRYGISEMSTGIAAATAAEQRATASSTDTVVEVASTTGWTGTGEEAYWEKEAVIIKGLLAGPPRLQLIRGIYHSDAVAHEYDAYSRDGLFGDLGHEPRLFTRAVTWRGQRVQLWLQEAVEGSTAVCVWRGKIRSFEMQDDGVTWQMACESIWDAQRIEICSGFAETRVRGMDLGGATLNWQAIPNGVGAFVAEETDSFVLPSTIAMSALEILNEFVSALNASLNAHGTVAERFGAGTDDEGRMTIRQIDPQAAGAYRLHIWWTDDKLGVFFWNDPLERELWVPAHPDQPGVYGFPVDAVVQVNRHDTTDISVESTDGFVQFDTVGVGWRARTGVVIGENVFELRSIDAPNYLFTIHPLFPSTEAITISGAPGESVSVKQCLILTGVFPEVWRYGLLENASIPARWKMGLRSSDFDWADMQLPSGIGAQRARVITKPVVFKELLQEDIRWGGLVPAIGDGGKLTTRLLGPPAWNAAAGDLDANFHQRGRLARLRQAEDELLNHLTITAQRLGWGDGTKQDFTYDTVDVTSVGLFGGSEGLEIKTDALFREVGGAQIDPADFAAYCAQLAAAIFAMFGAPNWVGELPCTIRGALLLPGDVGFLSHATVIDPDTGDRGVTNSLALITGVKVDLFAAQTQVSVFVPADGSRRSGWAPCARVTDYVDNGGGAGAAQHELVLDVGHYNGDLGNEGLEFLNGMRVVLMQRDKRTPLSDNLIVSSAEHNVAGTSVYVTSAPANDPGTIGGTWWLYFRPYDTAGQTARAKEFVHVCDEDDGLIAATGDRGFKAV